MTNTIWPIYSVLCSPSAFFFIQLGMFDCFCCITNNEFQLQNNYTIRQQCFLCAEFEYDFLIEFWLNRMVFVQFVKDNITFNFINFHRMLWSKCSYFQKSNASSAAVLSRNLECKIRKIRIAIIVFLKMCNL